MKFVSRGLRLIALASTFGQLIFIPPSFAETPEKAAADAVATAKKILYLCACKDGFINLICTNQIKKLKDTGHQVDLFCIDKQPTSDLEKLMQDPDLVIVNAHGGFKDGVYCLGSKVGPELPANELCKIVKVGTLAIFACHAGAFTCPDPKRSLYTVCDANTEIHIDDCEEIMNAVIPKMVADPTLCNLTMPIDCTTISHDENFEAQVNEFNNQCKNV